MATEAIARYGCPSTAMIFMMHLVAVAGLVFRAHGNPEIRVAAAPDGPRGPDRHGVLHRPRDRRPLLVSRRHRAPSASTSGWHVRKTAAFTTSSGYADWYLTQTTSPDFAGDYSDLSRVPAVPDEVQGKPGRLGRDGHAREPVGAGRDRRRDPRRTASSAGRATAPRSNDEAIDPLAFLQYAGAYNGVAMACLDVARRHALRRAHAQYGRRIADYATSQDALRPRALRGAGVAACSPTRWPRRWTTPPTAAAGRCTRGDPDAAPRAAFTAWGLEAKVLAAGLASRVSDAMLQLCGGRGYTRGGRDRAAGARRQGRLGDGAVERGVAADRRPLGAARRRQRRLVEPARRRARAAQRARQDGRRSRSGGWSTSSAAELAEAGDLTEEGRWRSILPPKSEDVDVRPAGARPPRHEARSWSSASPTTSASGSRSSPTSGSGRCSST